MCVLTEINFKSSIISDNSTSDIKSDINVIVNRVLKEAQKENRLIIGLLAAVQTLSRSPEDALFCFLAQPDVGDSATHMHEVLLEAYCFEHDIYIIKVDSSEKLSRIMGSSQIEPCVLIQKTVGGDLVTRNDTLDSDQQSEDSSPLSEIDDILVDYCEQYWDKPTCQPIIELPES